MTKNIYGRKSKIVVDMNIDNTSFLQFIVTLPYMDIQLTILRMVFFSLQI